MCTFCYLWLTVFHISIHIITDNIETAGVRPSGDSIADIPAVLKGYHHRSLSAQVDSVKDSNTGPRHRKNAASTGIARNARSFIEKPDGSITALTPLEMGRHELYEELPFLAVPGLQKKEHSLSVAFSSYAAALDTLETEEYLTTTTGKGLNPDEKEQRLSQMSLLLLDELETEASTVTTPLIFAVLIASLLMFNAGYNISVMNAPEPYVFPGHTTGQWSWAVAAFCIGGECLTHISLQTFRFVLY